MSFFAGYPITPSSEIAETLAKLLPELGRVFIQAEDEIAAMAMAVGASLAGAKSMTATSGPGFSLHPKSEQKFEKGKSGTGLPKPPPGNDDPYLAFDQGRYLTALELAQKLVEKGDARAHTLIARIHAEGLGVPKNEGLAAQWYKRSAELGDIDGVFAYGVILAEGRGVKKDRDGAAQMFERAVRLWAMSPTSATVSPSMRPKRSRMVRMSSSPWVGCSWAPSPALSTEQLRFCANNWAVPGVRWRTITASMPIASMYPGLTFTWRGDKTDSPGAGT